MDAPSDIAMAPTSPDADKAASLSLPAQSSLASPKPLTATAVAASNTEKRSCGFGGSLCEHAVFNAVEEYLTFHGFQESLSKLRAVAERRRQMFVGKSNFAASPCGCTASGEAQGDGKRTMVCATLSNTEFAVAGALGDFDSGDRLGFFNLWRRLVPEAAARSPAGCSLEMRLHVHFGIFRVRRSLAAAGTREGPAGGIGAGEELVPDFEDLKAFLSEHPNTALEASSESLAPLFALPFVSLPHTRPGLRFIFEEPWVGKLRDDTHVFLLSHAAARHAPSIRHLAGAMLVAQGPQIAPPPASWHELLRIADLGLATAAAASEISVPDDGLGNRQPVAEHRVAECLRDVTSAKQRLVAVTANPSVPPPAPAGNDQQGTCGGAGGEHNVFGPLAACVAPGQGNSPLVVRERLWPMSREALLSAKSAESGSPARRLCSARSLESRARTATASLPVPPALDFGRIAEVIAACNVGGEVSGGTGSAGGGSEILAGGCGGSEEAPLTSQPPLRAILRAVLRRLALPGEPVRPRRAFLAAFACFRALRTLAGRLDGLIAAGDPQLTELALAVLAVCACEVVGRREIEAAEAQESISCMATLVAVLKQEPVASPIHMQCLAVLQRLSLRSSMQARMIELGVVGWILQTLPSIGQKANGFGHSGPSLAQGCGPAAFDFSAEFISALLRNLTLRRAGRRLCGEQKAFDVLVCFIEHPNLQVRTHINGTLYCLLGERKLRSEARARNAEAVFTAALARSPPDDGNPLRKQMEHLLKQLLRDDDIDAAPVADTGEEGEGAESDAEESGDAGDGDNFLDEEELAGLFLLAPPRAAGGIGCNDGCEQAAAAVVYATEAAAAEEALRCFRASAAVADAQQRRFHAFIAPGYRGQGVASPKKVQDICGLVSASPRHMRSPPTALRSPRVVEEQMPLPIAPEDFVRNASGSLTSILDEEDGEQEFPQGAPPLAASCSPPAADIAEATGHSAVRSDGAAGGHRSATMVAAGYVAGANAAESCDMSKALVSSTTVADVLAEAVVPLETVMSSAFTKPIGNGGSRGRKLCERIGAHAGQNTEGGKGGGGDGGAEDGAGNGMQAAGDGQREGVAQKGFREGITSKGIANSRAAQKGVREGAANKEEGSAQVAPGAGQQRPINEQQRSNSTAAVQGERHKLEPVSGVDRAPRAPRENKLKRNAAMPVRSTTVAESPPSGRSGSKANVVAGGAAAIAGAGPEGSAEGSDGGSKQRTPQGRSANRSAPRSKSTAYRESSTEGSAGRTPEAAAGNSHRGRRGSGAGLRRTNSPASAPPQRLPPLVPSSDVPTPPAAATSQPSSKASNQRAKSHGRAVDKLEVRSRPLSGGRSSSGGRRPSPANAGHVEALGEGAGCSSSVPQLPRIVHRRS